jgi:hypothetical protein
LAIEHALDVLCEQVELEVHQIAAPSRGEIRLRSGVRNDPDRETFRQNFRDGEADPVHGDGSFTGDVPRKLRGQLDFEPKVRSRFIEHQNRRGAINVTLDKVSAEMCAGGEGELEVYTAPRLEVLEIRSIKGLLQNIECQLVAIAGGNGETAAVNRDAVSDADSAGKLRGRDFQLFRPTIRAERYDGADFFDEAGEHGSRIATPAGEASAAER